MTSDAPGSNTPTPQQAWWRVAAIVVVGLLVAIGVAVVLRPSHGGGSATSTTSGRGFNGGDGGVEDVTGDTATDGTDSSTPADGSTADTSVGSTSSVPATAVPDGKTSDQRRLVSSFVVSNTDLQPKSIVASGTGLFFAQNMMYRHNVMVFDRGGNTIAKIPDTVDLAAYGVAKGVTAQGSPVEAAFTPDASFVYVSNYKMYGPGYHPTADDNCNKGTWDDSYVYKINTTTFHIDKVIRVGAVPKFLAVTPDGRRLLVSDWCGFDVTVIDTATDTPIVRIPVGRHPRGIAITKDSSTAYVAIMGEAKILRIDLGSNRVVASVGGAGQTPRHLVLSPDGRYLYVSNNYGNSVRKIDLHANAEVALASTGAETRSMAISDDGLSLYVVNYADGTVSKVRTADMKVLQTLHSGMHPVGITYDKATRQVWVANYTGSLHVFVDQ